LVIFDSGENVDLFDNYFELKEQLEVVFKRQVDLVVDKKFKNPILRESIDRTRIVIYER
jgi:predicted nucleotidyltransferase